MIAGRYLNGRGQRILTLASLSAVALFAGGAALSAETPEPAESQAQPAPVQAKPVVAKEAAPFAVVELFTSESCPSCPTADRLLSELGAQARKHNQRLMPLAFHVDYWRSGRAADPYSATAFADRQKTYAAVLDDGEVYTPQMVVNGRVAFIGSEKSTAERQIKSAFSRPAAATVALTVEDGSSPGTLRVNCDVRSAATSANLQLAVVERNLSGRGRDRLDNVVRVFKTVPLSKGSVQSIELPLPRGLVRKNASVVAYVQDSRSLAILGASSVDIGSTVGRMVSAE